MDDTGRERLRSALHPRATRGQFVAALLCALLGFAVVVQVRANQGAGLTGLRQTDLVRILDDVSERSARLQAEARDLEQTRQRLASGTDGSRAALAEARQRALTLGILAGTLPASGAGIEFTISDPTGQVKSDLLLDALQELRDAGAEAVEIGAVNGATVRVTASTHLGDRDGSGGKGVEVDRTALNSPYVFRVIGEPRTLAAALDIPGGVIDNLRQRDAQGVIAQRPALTISTLRPASQPQYARPAPEATAREGGG